MKNWTKGEQLCPNLIYLEQNLLSRFKSLLIHVIESVITDSLQMQIPIMLVLPWICSWNYEEGGEKHIEHGDEGSEQFLSEIIGAASYPAKHMSMDSMYEYGSRAGFWRIHSEFQRRKLPMTIFGVAMALVRNPYIVEAIKQADYDVVSHGYRWLHYQETDLEVENSIWSKPYLF